MKRNLILITVSFLTIISGCSKVHPEIKYEKESFTLWNPCEAITALKDYVEDVTSPYSMNYIRPEDRIATFDMDGTFIGELYPVYFEYNLLMYRVLEDDSYKDIAPQDVRETALQIKDFVTKGTVLPDDFEMKHARAAAKAYAGMTIPEFDAYVKAYAEKPVNGFTGMTYAQSTYKPMLEIFDYLKANGFTCYVVSGSDRFICRALTGSLGIESNRVIGMDVGLKASGQGDQAGIGYTMTQTEELIRTDEVIIKNVKTNKIFQIAQEIGKIPVLSFGNSTGDAAMHNYCLSNPLKSAAFMLVADDPDRDHADRQKALALSSEWRKAGYHIISMRDDFKTIYGFDVIVTDFNY